MRSVKASIREMEKEVKFNHTMFNHTQIKGTAIEFLLSKGANTDCVDAKGKTVRDYAEEYKWSALVNALDVHEKKFSLPSTRRGSMGTAWFVNSNHVVTCSHVCGYSLGKKYFLLVPGQQREVPLELVSQDEKNDIAILKVADKCSFSCMRPLAFNFERTSVSLGEKLFTIGFPMPEVLGQSQKYEEGTVSSLVGLADDTTLFQSSIAAQPGNSGGPVVSEDGSVVGMITSGLNQSVVLDATGRLPNSGISYAIHAIFIRSVMERVRLPVLRSSKFSSRDEVIRVAEGAVYQIVTR